MEELLQELADGEPGRPGGEAAPAGSALLREELGSRKGWEKNWSGTQTTTGQVVPAVPAGSGASLTKVQALGVVALQQVQQEVPQVVGRLSGNTGNQQNQSEGSETGGQARF